MMGSFENNTKFLKTIRSYWSEHFIENFLKEEICDQTWYDHKISLKGPAFLICALTTELEILLNNNGLYVIQVINVRVLKNKIKYQVV